MSVPNWVIKQKEENTIFLNNYIEVAMNGTLELNGNTTLQKLSRLRIEVKDLVTIARKSFIEKNKWSNFISFYKDLANTEVKKDNLDKLKKYIELYNLSI
ncbi:hypothetical protein SAMN04489761_3455 [Tenacibaculum sp. MAR_2009_124]|uniref:hypothetical protein n=1 Tax=Tenacibaculum sp. MAR_2009_124 TaxID=1250059 RepID=UPI00089615FD|nr:hypothetical protein [Tenacibaculum sp. MAR_2009_124]SEC66979.1 hypothetical protein SAMN04489761_3455 [Tenacibaculum sp. MAR_2009_124]